MNHRWARQVVLVGIVGLCACGAPRPARVTVLGRASTERPPDPAAPDPAAPLRTREPPSYEATLARELSLPSEASGDLSGADHLHFVLDAGRCYRMVMVAEGRVTASLRDARGEVLATGAGRIVRFSGICPRWTGSFDLRVELVGSRGRAALYSDDEASR